MMPRLTLKTVVLLLFSSTWGITTACDACLRLSDAANGSKAFAMLRSIVARGQGITSSGASTSTLESGILAQSIMRTFAVYPLHDEDYETFLDGVMNGVSGSLLNSTADEHLPLDRFLVGTAIFDHGRRSLEELKQLSGNLSLQQRAYVAIAESLSLQTRNDGGGFWYYVYPNWSYLDGMVSLLPFLARDRLETNTSSIREIQLQMSLLLEHCKHESGLLVHGYDFSREAIWANPETGGSPYVWSRSLGWFLLGLVETYESLACHWSPDARFHALCSELKDTTVSLVTNLTRYADKETGAWYQLTTLGGKPGNYLESSGTALFITSMLRSARLGMLGQDGGKTFQTVVGAAKRAFGYVLENFVTDTGNGTIGYDKTVAVCSLNSTASYEYYTTQPVVHNSVLGESAFMLASLEMERKRFIV